jgi:hypothetical protein
MPIDFSTLPPEHRARLVRVGRLYGSDRVYDQATEILLQLQTHGATLADFGFSSEDSDNLRDAQALIAELGGARTDARADKSVTRAALRQAVSDGKRERLRARGLLGLADSLLRAAGEPAGSEVRARLSNTLSATRAAGADPTLLAEQLEQLAARLADPKVAETLADRGGPASLAATQSAAATLRAADQAHSRALGTATESERLDIADGFAVELLRQARRAARLASSFTGSEALAKVFAFTILRG